MLKQLLPAFMLGGGGPLCRRTFSKLLGDVLKRPAFFPAPKFAVTAIRGSVVADCQASDRPVPG